MLTCLGRFSNSTHVGGFLFRQAHGKGFAHMEQHQDVLAQEGFWVATGSAPAHECDIPDCVSQPAGVADDGLIHGGTGFVCVVLALEVRHVHLILVDALGGSISKISKG